MCWKPFGTETGKKRAPPKLRNASKPFSAPMIAKARQPAKNMIRKITRPLTGECKKRKSLGVRLSFSYIFRYNVLPRRLEGTPAYLPPEILTKRVRLPGFAADAWALGCVTYFCLHGRPKFFGDNDQVWFVKFCKYFLRGARTILIGAAPRRC